MITSCQSKNAPSGGRVSVPVDAHVSIPEVKTVVVKESMFHHEILANGVVVCMKYVDAYFHSNDVIANIMVKNGDYVEKGTVLATLDSSRADMGLAQARLALEQAELEYKDALIGQGYDPSSPEGLSTETISLLELRSGMRSARLNLEMAEMEKRKMCITAPLDGVVANVSQIAGNKANTSSPFCRILSRSDMGIEFKVIEPELTLIRKGDAVELIQESGRMPLEAYVSEINPVIGDDGQILLKAKVSSNNSSLIPGQHLKIAIQRDIEKSIVIPKSAVVMRDHRAVVFTYADDSTAQWNYVDVLHENHAEYAVEGLDAGMEIIFSGNKNLSNGTRVKKMN